MAKRTKGQDLAEKLTWSAPNIGKEAPEQASKANKFCEGYKLFLNEAKTNVDGDGPYGAELKEIEDESGTAGGIPGSGSGRWENGRRDSKGLFDFFGCFR